MIPKRLTRGQRIFLKEAYSCMVTQKMTQGSFRNVYHDSCQQRKYSVEETLVLEKSGLVKLAKDFIQAGIIVLSLTNTGRKYTGALK